MYMGNCLAYGRMKNKCRDNSGAVIMKNHDKVVERVKAMLMDMCGYGGLPLRCEMKFWYFDDHGHLNITPSPGSPDPDPLLLNPSGRGKRIKLIFTKQELQELLSNKVSMEDKGMVLGISEKEVRINTTTGSGWKPVLGTIPEGSEYTSS